MNNAELSDREARTDLDPGIDGNSEYDTEKGAVLGAAGGAVIGAFAGGPIGAVVGAVAGGVISAAAVAGVDTLDNDGSIGEITAADPGINPASTPNTGPDSGPDIFAVPGPGPNPVGFANITPIGPGYKNVADVPEPVDTTDDVNDTLRRHETDEEPIDTDDEEDLDDYEDAVEDPDVGSETDVERTAV